jgi:hypothetical protein
VADLREANTAQNRRMSQMQKEIDSLREALRESHEKSVTKMGDFATREDLKKIMDNVREVDQRRESDKKVILEEFEKLGRTLSQPIEANRLTVQLLENCKRKKRRNRKRSSPQLKERFFPTK